MEISLLNGEGHLRMGKRITNLCDDIKLTITKNNAYYGWRKDEITRFYQNH